MDWQHPLNILLIVPALAGLWWFQRRSLHPMPAGRRRALLAVRGVLVGLLLLASSQPASRHTTHEQAVMFVLDHSQSQGEQGLTRSLGRAQEIAARLPADTFVGYVSTGRTSRVLARPSLAREALEPDFELLARDGAQTDLESGLLLARGLFPPDTAQRVVLLSDGLETRGDLLEAARVAAVAGVSIDTVGVAGQSRPDVRLVRLRTSRSQLNEGAALELTADVESSLTGTGLIRLFENGIEVESRPLKVAVGQQQSVSFRRTPDQRGMYTYRVRVEGFAGDQLPENDESLALADVLGQPTLLYIEGAPDEAHYLADAMAKEGLRLETRPPRGLPEGLEELAGFDGVILSDVSARELSNQQMSALHDYVEELGGGFLMIGGPRSFGVGGYYRTPIEELLPVKIKAPDVQLEHSKALALVIDRSGSMGGAKIELCKSACLATIELLRPQDYLAVVAFDQAAHWIVPMASVGSSRAAAGQVSSISAGGGTDLQPAMTDAYEALKHAKARLKHMIILTDGHTSGGGYEALASQMKQEGMTVSTVGVGADADVGLMQRIAAAGGGQAYMTTDPANLPKIFTQDTMVHIGKLIREEAFVPRQVEQHPMLSGWNSQQTPALLGYVKTHRKSLAQVPLVTDQGDPLLAIWRFGLGKSVAFTSDCKSRWAASWIAGWPGYSRFWAQVLREMARCTRGRGMELRLEEQRSRSARVTVDLVDEPGEFKNDAQVAADVYFVPAGAGRIGSRHLQTLALEQTAPGRYEQNFELPAPGVYLVRAASGGDSLSAGLVSNLSDEAALGQIDVSLLERVAAATGGRLLAADQLELPPIDSTHVQYRELSPLLLRLLLLLFLADVLIRRWENVLGISELFSRPFRGSRS
jgi:uncharacterized membrane protein